MIWAYGKKNSSPLMITIGRNLNTGPKILFNSTWPLSLKIKIHTF
jgi:hypothetical protein